MLPSSSSDNAIVHANNINNRGIIVGEEYQVTRDHHIAVIWDGLIAYDLNRRVNNNNVRLRSALDINNQGQIIAIDDNLQSYLLTP